MEREPVISFKHPAHPSRIAYMLSGRYAATSSMDLSKRGFYVDTPLTQNLFYWEAEASASSIKDEYEAAAPKTKTAVNMLL